MEKVYYYSIIRKFYTFSYNNKSSLLKLLCTLLSLWKEPPFNYLDLTSLETTFPCIFAHNCHFSLFTVMKTEHGEIHIDPTSAFWSSTCLSQIDSFPNHISRIGFQGQLHAMPLHPVFLHGAGGIYLCVPQNIFYVHSPCPSCGIALTREVGEGDSIKVVVGCWFLYPIRERRRNDNFGGDGPGDPFSCWQRGGLTWGWCSCCCASQREDTCPSPWIPSYLCLTKTATTTIATEGGKGRRQRRRRQVPIVSSQHLFVPRCNGQVTLPTEAQ